MPAVKVFYNTAHTLYLLYEQLAYKLSRKQVILGRSFPNKVGSTLPVQKILNVSTFIRV